MATEIFVTLGARGRFLAFPPYGCWPIRGVFFDLGQIAVFWFHPLWFLGIDGVFSRFWADGCFLAFSAMVSGISNCDRDSCDFRGVGSLSGLTRYSLWPMMGVFRILGKSLLFGITPYGFWAFIVFSAILGRWLLSGLFRYGFWDFELRPRFL